MPGKARTFKRGGLHRLECPMCPCYGYFTVAALEHAAQLPACFEPGCGAPMAPIEWELADILGVECAATAEYQAKCESVAHGQAGKAGHGRSAVVDGSSAATAHWDTPAEKAAAEIAKWRRSRARARRLGAFGVREIKRGREITTVRVDDAPIPF